MYKIKLSSQFSQTILADVEGVFKEICLPLVSSCRFRTASFQGTLQLCRRDVVESQESLVNQPPDENVDIWREEHRLRGFGFWPASVPSLVMGKSVPLSALCEMTQCM